MNGVVGKEEERQVIIQTAEKILQEMDDIYTQEEHRAKARFYSEAKQTVGRGILSGLIKE